MFSIQMAIQCKLCQCMFFQRFFFHLANTVQYVLDDTNNNERDFNYLRISFFVKLIPNNRFVIKYFITYGYFELTFFQTQIPFGTRRVFSARLFFLNFLERAIIVQIILCVSVYKNLLLNFKLFKIVLMSYRISGYINVKHLVTYVRNWIENNFSRNIIIEPSA